MANREAAIKELVFATKDYQRATRLIKAICNKQRIQILQLIHQKKVVSVTELYTKMKLAQPAMSQQLAILREAGMVRFQKQQQSVLYSINYERLQQFKSVIASLVKEK